MSDLSNPRKPFFADVRHVLFLNLMQFRLIIRMLNFCRNLRRKEEKLFQVVSLLCLKKNNENLSKLLNAHAF